MKKVYPKEVIEIHQEFQIASENLIAAANELLRESLQTESGKAQRLRDLGFINARQSEIEPGEEKNGSLNISLSFAKDVIKYYEFTYPNNKFLTEEQVKIICLKYNLVCGDVELYKGFVPENKLKLIEEFKVKDVDKGVNVIGSERYDGLIIYDNGRLARTSTGVKFTEISQDAPFKICAPVSDMDITDKTLKDNYSLVKRVVIPDPIVLQPVHHGYLIVCAWGDEASDEIVVNPNKN